MSVVENPHIPREYAERIEGVERHEMPNGSVVYYRDKDHSYWEVANEDGTCSKRVAGASTVAKNDGDTNNDGLMDWAVGLAYEGVAREASLTLDDDAVAEFRMGGGLDWLASRESIKSRMYATQQTWRHVRDEAGTRGSISHRVLEQLCEGVTPEPRSGYDAGVIAWWHATHPTPSLTETVVYSQRHGFAGRFDLFTEDLILRDLKTSKYISNAFAVQLNLYAVAMVEAGYPEPKGLAVIKVTEDGDFLEVPIPYKPEWAFSALDIYRDGLEMGREIRRAVKRGPAILDPRHVLASLGSDELTAQQVAVRLGVDDSGKPANSVRLVTAALWSLHEERLVRMSADKKGVARWRIR